MHNYEHKKLIEEISKLNDVPTDPQTYSEWISAEQHLSFLERNTASNDLVVYASGSQVFIHAVVVSNDRLSVLDKEDLLNWSLNPSDLIAGYVSGGGRDGVWVERGLNCCGSNTLKGAIQLVFARTFQGWSGAGADYYEINQEYTHLAGIHWRSELRAHCRYDNLGDIEPVVSVTGRGEKSNDIALVSFKRKTLEEYLAATNSSLVRVFDFNLFRLSSFNGWGNSQPQLLELSERLFYHQLIIPGYAAYTRGVQVVCPQRTRQEVINRIIDGWRGLTNEQYLEFVAYDWRNKKVAPISTDPSCSTNYFTAGTNSLPFELSPAFFRPEVLLKYKADRDKYTVGERDLTCRSAWYLRGIDVNEAGQVHTYICYLRSLPYEEQLHWRSFNEEPKSGISQRAIKNDFAGSWESFIKPLPQVLSIARRWHDKKVVWWKLRDERLLERVNTPLTTSRDEWAEAFMDLAKLVVEGFETKPIRDRLAAVATPYLKEDKTIALLEKLLCSGNSTDEEHKLVGLRTVQLLRSKAKGHAGGSEADQLAEQALHDYETYGNHFNHVCSLVAVELGLIQQAFLGE